MKSSHISSRSNHEQGASLVEFALVALLLILLLAGIVDLGRAFHSYIVITNASREGARYASRFPNHDVGIKLAAQREAAAGGLTIADDDIGVLGTRASGSPITVTITSDFPTIMGGILGIDTIPMERATEMVVFGLD